MELVPRAGHAVASPGTIMVRSRRADSHAVRLDPGADADRSGAGGRTGDDAHRERDGGSGEQATNGAHDDPFQEAAGLRPLGLSRARSRRLTEKSADFGNAWVSVAPAVRRMAAARGIRGTDAEDVVQEVGLRAFQAFTAGTIQSSLLGWCLGVTRNVVGDHWRREYRGIGLGEPTDRLSAECVEATIEARLDLVGLERAWTMLSADERALLRSGAVEVQVSPGDRNRYHVALHRARRRARRLAESLAPGFFAWVDRVRSTVPAGALEAALPVVAAAGYAVIALFPGTREAVEVRAPTSMTISALGLATSNSSEPTGGIVIGVPSVAPSGSATTAPNDGERDSGLDHRSEARLPDGRRAHGEIYEGEPDAPALCATAPPIAEQVCVSYPSRP